MAGCPYIREKRKEAATIQVSAKEAAAIQVSAKKNGSERGSEPFVFSEPGLADPEASRPPLHSEPAGS
jgi:hypothetical protein